MLGSAQGGLWCRAVRCQCVCSGRCAYEWEAAGRALGTYCRQCSPLPSLLPSLLSFFCVLLLLFTLSAQIVGQGGGEMGKVQNGRHGALRSSPWRGPAARTHVHHLPCYRFVFPKLRQLRSCNLWVLSGLNVILYFLICFLVPHSFSLICTHPGPW